MLLGIVVGVWQSWDVAGGWAWLSFLVLLPLVVGLSAKAVLEALLIARRSSDAVPPLIVKDGLGAQAAGYWYVASLMAVALCQLPPAVGASLLVESSRRRTETGRLVLWAVGRASTTLEQGA